MSDSVKANSIEINKYLLLVIVVISFALGMFVQYLIEDIKEGVCCGPSSTRRIDVAYPPGIRIGLTGPWTKNSDPLDRSFFNGIQ